MSVARDILAAWRSPRAVMRRQLRLDRREGRALSYLAIACLVIFLAQWPRLYRLALVEPDVPVDIRIGGALFAWFFIAPLVLYLLAGLSHLLARALGGQGAGSAARLALFWALLVAAPFWLLDGLLVAIPGAAPVRPLIGAVALFGFVAVWLFSLYEAERGDRA